MAEPAADPKLARILVSNDDGIDAPGIRLLEKIARELSPEVWAVAPGIAVHVLLHASHWWVKVEAGLPLQVPLLVSLRVCPTVATPLISGDAPVSSGAVGRVVVLPVVVVSPTVLPPLGATIVAVIACVP